MPAMQEMNTERNQVLEGILIGSEADDAIGTAVACDERLRSMNFDMKQDGNVQVYGASGSLFDTAAVQGEEFSSGTASGYITFTEIYKIFDGALGKVDAVTEGTLGKKRIWTPDPYNFVQPQTYTLETTQGYAERYTAAIFNGFKLNFTRKESTFTSNILAQPVAVGITPTPAPSLIALEAIVPHTVSLRMASSFATLAAATPLRRSFEASLEYTNPFGLIFPMVDDQVGADGISVVKPTTSFTVKMMKNSVSMGIIDSLRGATTLYFQIKALGAIIDAAPALYRSLTITVAAQVSKPFDPADDAGLKMVNWTFVPVPVTDADPFEITLINTLP